MNFSPDDYKLLQQWSHQQTEAEKFLQYHAQGLVGEFVPTPDNAAAWDPNAWDPNMQQQLQQQQQQLVQNAGASSQSAQGSESVDPKDAWKKKGDWWTKAAGQLTPIDERITELCEKFNIDDDRAYQLDALMKDRPSTFDEDMLRLWNDLERSRNPMGLLITKIKQLREGTFVGQWLKPDPEMIHFTKKFNLDSEAQKRFAECICRHPPLRRQQYYVELELHLEASGNPSALIMMMLKKIGNGEELGPVQEHMVGCGKGKGKGKDGKDGKDKDKDRSRSRGRDGDRREGDRRGGAGGRDWGRDDRDRRGDDRGGRGRDDRDRRGDYQRGRRQDSRDRGASGSGRQGDGDRGGRDYDRRDRREDDRRDDDRAERVRRAREREARERGDVIVSEEARERGDGEFESWDKFWR